MKASPFYLVLPFVVAGSSSASANDLAQRWQGPWVVRDAEYPGSVEAWSVQGDTVDVYDPVAGQHQREQFKLESPCRIVRTQSSNSGGSEIRSTNTFAFAPDGLHVAPATAGGGLLSGSVWTACVGDQTYTFDRESDRCQQWNETMSEGSPSAVECFVHGSPPAFILRRSGAGQDVRLGVSGDALLSPGLAGGVSERQGSFPAAIRLAVELSKPR